MPLRRLFTTALPLTLAAFAGSTAQAQTPSGADLFAHQCQMCHTTAPDGKPGAVGPNLRGVVGRKAASTGFTGYSAALKGSGITWTADRIERFLAAPAQMVPGTRMVMAVPDAAQRHALAVWLAGQR